MNPEPDSVFTCEICIEPVENNNKFNNNNTSSKCIHDFCSDCIAKYIESKVELDVANIKCPALSCNFSLDPLSCRPILSSHLFIKWSDLLCNETILNQYPNRFVYCPYRDCSALILDECKDKVNKCTCPNCKNKFCFRCKSPWHAGFRCREKSKFRDSNDVLAGELIEKKKWTRCPKCGNAVERTGGCIFVRCKCGTIFCHECGKANNGRLRICCKKGFRDYCLSFILVLTLCFLGWLAIEALLNC